MQNGRSLVNLRRLILREPSLLTLAGFALASASVVVWWRAPSVQDAGEFAPRPIAGLGVGSVRSSEVAAGRAGLEDQKAQALLSQDLLRRVDGAAAASGVRIGSVNVRAANGSAESATQRRLQLEFSAVAPYRAIKNLIEHILQADSRLALDRVSLTRTSETTGELDAQVGLHVVDSQP